MGGLNLIIRFARHDDLPTLLAIEQSSFINPFPPSLFQEIFRECQQTFLVASLDGQIVGYIMAIPEDKTGHIVSIAVSPPTRRVGIGTALMKELTRELTTMGIPSAYLEVRRDNQSGQTFYKNLGFVEKRVIMKYYPDEEDAIIMEKRLSRPDAD
jgi:ribosomal-protein-alanine N-acetyltransferase